MDNQHRKITGYRELSQTEIDLMNKVKALGVAIEGVINEVKAHNLAVRAATTNSAIDRQLETLKRIDAAEPERWLAMGRTDLQTGLMKLTRSIAQPGFF